MLKRFVCVSIYTQKRGMHIICSHVHSYEERGILHRARNRLNLLSNTTGATGFQPEIKKNQQNNEHATTDNPIRTSKSNSRHQMSVLACLLDIELIT